MLTEGMKKYEFLIHSRDIDSVIEYLGKAGCLQVTDNVRKEQSEPHKLYAGLEKRLNEVSAFLGLTESEETGANERLPKPEDIEEAETFLGGLKTLVEKERLAVEKKLRLEQAWKRSRFSEK